MKTLHPYKAYIRTVLLSVIAAFVIDAVINFDDMKRNFNAGRGKIDAVVHTATDTPFDAPQKVALVTGILYDIVFE